MKHPIPLLLAFSALVAAALLVSVPRYRRHREVRALKHTVADMHTVAIVLNAFHEAHGFYPATSKSRVPLDEIEPQLRSHLAGPLPVDDGWGNSFLYTSDARTFELRALGSDQSLSAIGTTTSGRAYVAITDARADIVITEKGVRSWPEGLTVPPLPPPRPALSKP